MKLDPEHRVDMATARRRALNYLAACHPRSFTPASAVGVAIWPANRMTAQGCGAAASRVLRRLQELGLVRWGTSLDEGSWGWQITSAGRGELEGK